jgi:hypothetical protein
VVSPVLAQNLKRQHWQLIPSNNLLTFCVCVCVCVLLYQLA